MRWQDTSLWASRKRHVGASQGSKLLAASVPRRTGLAKERIVVVEETIVVGVIVIVDVVGAACAYAHLHALVGRRREQRLGHLVRGETTTTHDDHARRGRALREVDPLQPGRELPLPLRHLSRARRLPSFSLARRLACVRAPPLPWRAVQRQPERGSLAPRLVQLQRTRRLLRRVAARFLLDDGRRRHKCRLHTCLHGRCN